MIHIYPHAVDLGISPATATNFLATIGGASIIGRFVMGSAGDRIGNKLSIIADLIVLSVAMLWLLAANEVWMLYLFTALYGFAHGGLFTLLSPMIAEMFGLRSHGEIFGTIFLSVRSEPVSAPLWLAIYLTLLVVISSASSSLV